MIRTCTVCGHSELHHFQLECAGLPNWTCFCPGFCARQLTPAEYDILTTEAGTKRGQIGDAEVEDEYSAIREHLGRIMEKASQ